MTDDGPAPLIYLVTPPLTDAALLAPALESILASTSVASLLLELPPALAGADAKKAVRGLMAMAQDHGAAVLVRDPALAARIGADGVHLGAGGDEDLASVLQQATQALKPERIVGAGGFVTKHEAMIAGEGGADYVMFGEPAAPLATPTERIVELIAWWAEIFTPPCVAYAARLADAAEFAAAGADFIAFGAALWSDPRGPARALREAMEPLRREGAP